MEKETARRRRADPIIIEQAGMRMTVAHRQGLGGTDEGLTFDITTVGLGGRGKTNSALRLLLQKPPLSRRRLRRRTGAAHKMKDEGVEDPVRWTLDQLKTRFPAMVKQAGYGEIAERIDQQAITDQLTQLEREIIDKY